MIIILYKNQIDLQPVQVIQRIHLVQINHLIKPQMVQINNILV